MIFNDLLQSLEAGRSPILLTERTEHLEYFAGRLKNFARNIIVLRGGMGRRQRKETARRLASIPDGEERLLLATGRYIGEGFDDARLDTLFLALPISWRGTLQQYAGRLHRAHAGKRVVQIYDYVDEQVPVLARMYRKRLRSYRATFSACYKTGHRFTAVDIAEMHRVWLGRIYQWAGNFRQVHVNKSGFLFSAPAQIPNLMTTLEAGPLRKYTPCRFPSRGTVIEAIAEVHVELVLIHPFRDGNGRVARMLAVVMGLQAGLPPLDFSGVRLERQVYFNAVRSGLDREYRPMQLVFQKIIERTLRGYGKRSASSETVWA